MAGRASLVRAEPGFSLPFFDRLAPAPPPALVAARLEAHSGPGDIVLDLAGRGGWIAHAAIDRQRRAVSVESSPLSASSPSSFSARRTCATSTRRSRR